MFGFTEVAHCLGDCEVDPNLPVHSRTRSFGEPNRTGTNGSVISCSCQQIFATAGTARRWECIVSLAGNSRSSNLDLPSDASWNWARDVRSSSLRGFKLLRCTVPLSVRLPGAPEDEGGLHPRYEERGRGWTGSEGNELNFLVEFFANEPLYLSVSPV